jgi:hypothetical protein
MAPSLTTRFIGAAQLFGAYFHQDWRKESETQDENVLRFIRTESNAVRLRAIRDIEVLLEECASDTELGAALLKLGNHFDAPRSERTYRSWLQKVLTLLTHDGR